jgi:4-hydroxybenzoate polyprenyl transferase
MLLLYPCLWGLISASSSIEEIRQNIFLFIIFILGAFIMRSAGCVINDIFDRNIDIQVDRTKSRPLADKSISLHESIIIFITLSLMGLCILLSLNTLSIKVGLLSFILLIVYPLTKRITYWPQLFLALTFNIGVLIGYAAITNILPLEIYFLYAAGIFWTLGYDTIYAYQDKDDDILIGVKSTAILFKDSAKYWISSFYILMLSCMLIYGFLSSQEIFYFLLLILILSHQFFQIYKLDIKRPEVCLAIFKSNKYLGLLVCLVLLSNYIN